MNFSNELLKALESKTGKAFDVNVERDVKGFMMSWSASVSNDDGDRVSVVVSRNPFEMDMLKVAIATSAYYDTIVEPIGTLQTNAPDELMNNIIRMAVVYAETRINSIFE